MPKMYDVGGKLLNGIKSVYINSLDYVKVQYVRMIVSESIVV